MASSERLFGVTPPIKTDLPTPAETKSTEALLEELKRQGTFESSEETGKRYGFSPVQSHLGPSSGQCAQQFLTQFSQTQGPR